MANKKHQEEESPSKNVEGDSGKIVKKLKKHRINQHLPKPLRQQGIRKFNYKNLKKLGLPQDVIKEYLALPKKERSIRLIKEKSKNFNKISYLFGDLPQNSFSDAREDLNGWTLRDLMLLLSQVEECRINFPNSFLDGIPWQSIKGPRDGVKETWETITKKVPNTMEQFIKGVKTFVVVRMKRPELSGKLMKKPSRFLWNKGINTWLLIRNKIDNATSGRLNIGHYRLFNILSPLGRILISLKAMDKIEEECMEFLESYRSRRKKKIKDDFLWKFPSV